QIAQTIAAAGIPVVLKDIKQELVDAGLAEARNVTQGQIGKLAEKGKISQDDMAAQVDEVMGRIHGTTTYDGFGDVDFVIEGVRAATVVPMGPYFLVSLLGLDPVLHVAEHRHGSYGDRFYVPKGREKLGGEGRLGAKTGGEGFYNAQGDPNLPGDNEPDVDE